MDCNETNLPFKAMKPIVDGFVTNMHTLCKPKLVHGFEFRKTKHYEDHILILIFDPEMKRELKGEIIKSGCITGPNNVQERQG